MTMPDTFQEGTDWQQASEPQTIITVHESDCWPVDNRSGSGTKDQLDEGLHPVIAIGGRTAADGRPLNLTGVVVSMDLTVLGTATDQVRVNIADGYIVRQYVANVLTYSGGAANTFETAPVPGQPVYVDDSDDLSEGVTLSMSPLNDADVRNPLAGYLFYCQDEYADAQYGGARSSSTFDTSLANELVEQEFCVLLVNAARELA
jgi:hypothetical protein